MASPLPVRVLLVDDSPIFLEAFSVFLEDAPDLHLVGSAANGREALEQVQRLQPDLVVMDVMMPVMDGIQAVEEIMCSRPTPILLVTGEPCRQGDHWSFEALSRGALELMPKPALMDWSSKEKVSSFIDHLKLLASVPVVYRSRPRRPKPQPRLALERGSRAAAGDVGGLGIVASTGGPAVLADILGALPPDFPLAILVVQHLAEDFAPRMVSWLNAISPLAVSLGRAGEKPEPGHVYVAPDDAHMVLDERGCIALDKESPPTDGHRPSGTRLLDSLASCWGESATGLLLTGMGRDGALGLLAIRRAGGVCLAQDEESCVVFGMPQAARELGAVDRLLSRGELASNLLEVARRGGGRRAKA